MFKPYQFIMVLNHRFNDVYCDYKATYIGIEKVGSKKGLHKVEIQSFNYHFAKEKLMDHDEYMKIYNEDKTKLPEIAAKKLFFLEGIK